MASWKEFWSSWGGALIPNFDIIPLWAWILGVAVISFACGFLLRWYLEKIGAMED
jgi:hypothetical protein